MENIKETLLSYISAGQQLKVEPLIDQVLWFYGSNITLSRTDETLSSFARDVQCDAKPKPLPLARIFLSTKGATEEALVHELLHLAMPLRHGVYGIGFATDDEPVKELVALISNVLEHDLFLQDYLDLGYSLNNFLGGGGLNIDYKARIKEGA